MNTNEFILAIDQGTTGSTVAYFTADGLRYFNGAKQEFKQHYPQPGWVEHDVEEIWQSVMLALAQAKKSLPSGAKTLAIGITNQRETVVAWNRKTGEAAGRAIVWQDRRTADFCNELKANDARRKTIFEKTGLVCDPYFSASKMRWMMQHYPACQRWRESGELVFGTIDAYLIYRLTAGKSVCTEHTNASRTMLYNLRSCDYDDELLSLFGVKRSELPTVMPSSSEFGLTRGVDGVADGTPILGNLGDQQAALFGQNADKAGEAKITFGTGAFLLMHTGNAPCFSMDGLLTTAAYSYGNKRSYALEGAAFVAGAAIQFVRDNFKWLSDAAKSEEFALSHERDPNVIFVPAFAGLGSPYWNPHAKATLFGVSRGTSQQQIVRAVLESIALQNVQLLTLMQKASGVALSRVGVDGKAALNNFLMQFQADTLGTKLVRPENIDTTAKGAARAALVTLSKDEKVSFQENVTEFEPRMDRSIATNIVTGWSKAADLVNKFYV